MNLPLTSPVTVLKGIGEKRAELLQRLGIETCEDLLRYFPRDYLDLTHSTPIREWKNGQPVAVTGKITSEIHVKKTPRLTVYSFRVADSAGDTVFVTLFNQHYTAQKLHPGLTILLYGKPEITGNTVSMASPLLELSPEGKIYPIYSLTEGLTQKMLAMHIRTALTVFGPFLTDILSPQLRKTQGYDEVWRCFEQIHFPDTMEFAEKARERFIFEELYLFSVGIRLQRMRTRKLAAPMLHPVDMTPFLNCLPYRLTRAQTRVIREALNDMRKKTPMARLVQGDVGSGKTAVAAALFYFTVKNGYQACMMAPTEILAGQHTVTLKKFLEPCGIRIELLTGSVSPADKKRILALTERGEVDLLVGTHALLQKQVVFQRLALAVTDEQHRFGVEQRMTLSEKGEHPHLLYLSATPIPRSLALVLYGDLDISVLDELPPGRTPVQTRQIPEENREKMYRYIAEQGMRGEQAYIVCPQVEDSEESSLKSVTGYSEELQQKFFARLPTAILHGRMKADEKDRILQDFLQNKIRILISTTVIEVGVDVPNASVMVIENADRFGLSQLHQLRGRVGRGQRKSYCFLLSETKNDTARQRLKTFCQTNDGFEISKKDLELRGPGDFFGSRQHGLPGFRIANLIRDIQILQQVTQAADLLVQDPSWYLAPENRNLFVAVSAWLRLARMN